MTIITRAELLALARVSNIDLTPEELDSMSTQLAEVLHYAARVKEFLDMPMPGYAKNSNVLRADIPISSDSEIVLAQAPEREANYFIVPLILEGTTESKLGNVL